MENIQVEKINSSNRLKKTLSMCILGLFLFLILILVYEYLRIVPENVRFTNVTSTSVTVSWNTKNPISATAVYKKGDGGFINLFGIGKQVFYDTRDLVKAELKAVEQTGKNIAKSDDISVSMSEVKTEVKVTDKGKYYTHHVEIKGLDPETDYSFFVGDELLYKAVKDIDGNTMVKTTKVAESIDTPVPAYSSVKDAQNKEGIKYSDLIPVKDGVVYVNYLDDLTGTASNQFSAVLNEDGNWYADLSTAVDNEGNLFLEKYDTEAKNLKIIITLNAGPLGIWRQWQNAYTIAPAQEIVINMVNGITDGAIEGSVTKLSLSNDTKNKEISQSREEVKGVLLKSVNAASRYQNCEESGGIWTDGACICPRGYKLNSSGYCVSESPSCTRQSGICACNCPASYSETKPLGEYDTTTVSCPTIDNCGKSCGNPVKKTCYKAKTSSSCTCNCTPTCPADYPVTQNNGLESVEKTCTTKDTCGKSCTKSIECYKAMETLPQQTCKGRIVSSSASKSSCLYYLSFSCSAPCYYVDGCDSGGDPHYVKCSSNFCDNTGIPGLDCRKEPPQEDLKCENTNIKVGTYGYVNDKCKKCDWTVVNNYGGYGLKLIDAEDINCSPDPKCGWNGGKSFANGTVLTSNLCSSGTPSPTTVSISKGDNSWKCKQGTKEVSCSATVLSETPNQPQPNDEDPELQEDSISEISPKQYCWSTSDIPIYFYDNEKDIMYFCDNHKLSEMRNYENNVNATYCQIYANEGKNECNSPALLEQRGTLYSSYSYCIVNDVIYYCHYDKWEKAEDAGKEDDIIVEPTTTIEPGQECTGRDMNFKCQCSGSTDFIDVGQWCVEVTSCTPDDKGQVCDLDGKMCDGYGCSNSNVKSNIPELIADEKTPCEYPLCRCVGGADYSVKVDQFCKQVDGCNSEEIDEQLNKICNNEGNTCKHNSTCSGNKDIEYVNSAKEIEAGKKCTFTDTEKENEKYNSGACKCKSGPDIDSLVNEGKYCRNISYVGDDNCKNFYNNCKKEHGAADTFCEDEIIKQVCNQNGNTCTSGSWECTGSPIDGLNPVNNVNENNTLSINKPIINLNNFKVSAQSKNINSQYIIDQKTGMFVNLPQGEYIFEYEGQQYYFQVTDPYGNKRVFIDKGLDGKYDEGTDILVSDLASIVQIEPIELRYTYVLKQGFNFVSFPFLVSNQEYRTAAGLLKKLNDVYEDSIYSIAKYDGSWKVVGQNIELYSSNDFQLLPGQGYVIKTKNNVTIDIWGKPIKYDNDSPNAPVALFKGWNLVGLYGSGVKQYTAKTLLEDINKYEKVDFSADNVSKWESELQRYEGFQVADKNGVPTEYGFDYPINLLNSYFVRVQEGEGNWQPELAQ